MARKRGRTLLITAIAAILVGVVGFVATAALMPSTAVRRGATRAPGYRPPGPGARGRQGSAGEFSSVGERIFLTGQGRRGAITIDWGVSGGMMGEFGRGPAPFGCVRCHGRDGRGSEVGMMYSVEAPDITYGYLTSEHTDDSGSTEPAWTDADIERAIRDGREPDGESLDRMMPRWDMDATDMDAILGYLKELR